MLHFSFGGRIMLRSLVPVSDGTGTARLGWVGLPLDIILLVRHSLPAVLVRHDGGRCW